MSQLVAYCFFDPPQILDTSLAPFNIPANSDGFLQVIADTGVNTGTGVSYIDTTGELIGVYVGASGHEKLLCMIGNGQSGDAWAKILPHSRISLRAMLNQAITNGKLGASLFAVW